MNDAANPCWLTVLGIGDDGVRSLTPSALALLKKAQVLVAPERVLGGLDLLALGLGECEIVPWTVGVGRTLDFLQTRRGTPVTILATGDPMHFGIGATMRRSIPAEEMLVIPSPSGFSLAASRLGWALSEVACISLHGRSVAGLQPHILPANRIVSLTSTAKTIHEVAKMLVDRRFDESRITVLEHMGGGRERICEQTAAEIAAMDAGDSPFADFNVVGIACVAGEGAAVHAPVPGLPDDAFTHDGQLTKREVRAVTLAALQPCPHELLWDVGAGCGSIAIEWMRAARGAKAAAIETKSTRNAMIAQNAIVLGTPGLRIVEGQAPDALSDLEVPQAIFIGGGIVEPPVFDTCWQALQPGGRLVANAVTVEGEARLSALHAGHGGALTRIAIARAGPIGGFRGFKPLMPVTQWSVEKSRRSA